VKEDDDKEREVKRRRTIPGGLLPSVTDPGIEWSDDLRELPCVEFPHVLVYLKHVAGWSDSHMEEYKTSKGWQLHDKKHIIQVLTQGNTTMLQY